MTQRSGIEPVYPSIFTGVAGLVAIQTARSGGVSDAPLDSLNLGSHVGDDPAHVRENYRRLGAFLGIDAESIVTTGQVHGTEIALVTAPGNLDGYDALITHVRGLFVGIMTADCYPILIHDPRTGASGAAHAGWQGAAGRIAEKTVQAMRDAFGTRPEECLAWVGTGISGERYEIGGEVAARFSSRYLEPSPSGEGRQRLDLSAANRDQLLDAGLPPAQVQCSEFCSYRDVGRFFSYRRDHGKTGRMLALIGVRTSDSAL
ncbi:peptidoglycan editing factor PgeF [Chlorobaculum thiosulfatiphilum]|uniref:Purine nucleoside phosphorylase n=1 Tax=Chlorobaculum thiosulfatiphilum TaxID=115852 RepID=A0A5C4S204_CHLTI|nr:peptidoglycan editing factor PgeF [Chlorobaculum thiosulfatiphilum]TNJ37543.1 peptidoglycan editing factor PgeF [Chlorobaculum thiosulfatiphilum]